MIILRPAPPRPRSVSPPWHKFCWLSVTILYLLCGCSKGNTVFPGLSMELSEVLKCSPRGNADPSVKIPTSWPSLIPSWGGLCFGLYAVSVWKSSVLHGERSAGPLPGGEPITFPLLKFCLYSKGPVFVQQVAISLRVWSIALVANIVPHRIVVGFSTDSFSLQRRQSQPGWLC